MASPTPLTTQIDIAAYVDTLRRRWWLFVLIPVLVVAPVYLLTSGPRAQSYTATATVLVNPSSTGSAITSGDVYASNVLAQTYSKLVYLPEVYQRTATRLQIQGTEVPRDYTLSASADPILPLLTISATASDAVSAAAIANAAVSAFIDWLADTETAGSQQLSQTIASAQSDLDQASAELAALQEKPEPRSAEDAARIGTLQGIIEQRRAVLDNLGQVQQGQAGKAPLSSRLLLMSPAEPPSPAASRIPRIAYSAIALIFSIGLVGLIAPGLDLVRQRIWRPSDIQRETSLPLLATIPRFRLKGSLDLINAPTSRASSAVRSLYTRVKFEMNGKGPGVTAVIATAASDGAARLAANLAVAFAQAGHQTILVDTSMAGSQIARILRIDERSCSHKDADDADREQGIDIASLLIDGPYQGLRLLLPNVVPPELANLMKGDQIRDLTRRLRAIADAIILVVPTSQENVDALLWIGTADQVVVTAEYGKSTSSALLEGIESVGVAKVPIVGAVGIEQRSAFAVGPLAK